jgi:hypothetical protein
VAFSFSLIATLAQNNVESTLPECCRRDGTHHCSGSMGPTSAAARESPGTSVKSVEEKCPYAPGRGAAQAGAQTPLPRSAGSTGASLASHPAGLIQTEARYGVSFSRVRQKRGPPSLIS